MPQIANPIKAEILRRNLSQKEIAFQIGCSPAELSRVIHGHRIKPDIRKKLCRILRVPERRLFQQHKTYVKRKAA